MPGKFKAPDAKAVEQLRDAYSIAHGANCMFPLGCNGPDTRTVTPMGTCSVHATAIYLRRALLRMNITP